MEGVNEMFKELGEVEDVGQRRYLMNRIFDLLVEKRFEDTDTELPGIGERIAQLRDFDGYMFKLSQDFLTESSTMRKREKLEDIRDHVF